MSCIYTGAVVSVPDYGFTAPADIFEVGDTYIVRFHANPEHVEAYRNYHRPPTHVLNVNPPSMAWPPLDPVGPIEAHNLFLRLDLGIVSVTKPYLVPTEHHRDYVKREDAVNESYGNVTQGG